MRTNMKLGVLGLVLMLVFSSGAFAAAVDFQAGGDRLEALQNNDGGWDWPLDDGNPANASPKNTVGPIAMGLAKAYQRTGDADQLTALQNAGGLLLTKTNNFSPSDGYLATELDKVLGGTTYVDHVTANFYNPLAAGTYDRNGAGTTYTTAGYVTLIRTVRANQGIANLAAWDIGMGLYAAQAAGAGTTDWIAGTKAEIDELDSAGDYDVIGLAGALFGLASVGEEGYVPTGGEHSGATDLAAILAGYQAINGSFDNKTQETAYAILALNEVDANTYWAEITSAVSYLGDVQVTTGTGGWGNIAGADENNEVTGEAIWAANVVPLPAAVWAGLMMMGGLGGVRVLRKKLQK